MYADLYIFITLKQEFKGNTDRNTVVTHKLPRSIKTRLIRIVVTGLHGYPSMRMELYGSQAPQAIV